MKIDYHSLRVCEIVEIGGRRQAAIIDGKGNDGQIGDVVRYIPLSDLNEKDDQAVLDMINAVCWQLPSRIDPFRDENEQKIEYEFTDQLYARFTKIAQRIYRLLGQSMYFKDDRYEAVCINFIFNSYFKDTFHYSPRIILSGTTVSGKTRLQNILAALCYRGFATIKPTFASMFRLIDRYSVTPIIDEAQRLKGERRDDLEDIFLSGDQKNRPIVRTNMNTLKTESFNIYGPMVISKKAGGYTPEDMENRAFTLKMIENRSKKLVANLDYEELTAIRNDLYSLYALYRIRPEAFKLADLFAESVRHLTDGDEDGRRICDFVRTDNMRTNLTGRSLDIATTYYTLSRLTTTEEDILSLLTDEQAYSSERLKDTNEAGIFHSLMICCQEHAKNNSLLRYPDMILRVPTRDITELFNRDQEESGNQRNSMERITGHRVTRTLKDMGFETGKGNHGLSYIKWAKDLDNVLDINLDKFGSEEDRDILEKIRRRKV